MPDSMHHSAHTPPPLILASSSRYRAQMLDRLGLPFTTATSGIDETPEPGETPAALVRRLALGKAKNVAPEHPEALIIGADQVSVLGDEILGKPGSRERAVSQIQRMSGQQVDYLSGIALVGPGIEQVDIVPTRLTYRTLEQSEIERYVDRDQPFDCAGAMRSESLGIALLESLESDDPTALIGMPLIRIAQWLRSAGYEIP